jgi:hypothetical protein
VLTGGKAPYRTLNPDKVALIVHSMDKKRKFPLLPFCETDPFCLDLANDFPYKKNGVYEFVPGRQLWSEFKLVGNTFNENVQDVRKHYQQCHAGVPYPKHVEWGNIPGQKAGLEAYKKFRPLITMSPDDLKNNLTKPKGNRKLLNELKGIAHSDKEAEAKWRIIIGKVYKVMSPDSLSDHE